MSSTAGEIESTSVSHEKETPTTCEEDARQSNHESDFSEIEYVPSGNDDATVTPDSDSEYYDSVRHGSAPRYRPLSPPPPIPAPYHPLRKRGGDLKESVVVGMKPEAMTLYQGKARCSCCLDWTDKRPDSDRDREHAKTKSMHGGYAVLVRMRKGHGGEKPFEMYSITVQSPLLKKVLLEVLKDYPGISPQLANVEFLAPCTPFVHRWEALRTAEKEEKNPETKRHIALLRQLLEPELEKWLKAADECYKHKVILFKNLWTVFRPGDLLLCKLDNQEAVVLLKSIPTSGMFVCDQVDWNGAEFGLASVNIHIAKFEGTRSIYDLEAMPLAMHQNPSAIRDRLVERGRIFEKLKGRHFKSFNGTAILSTVIGSYNVSRKVNERIVIDTMSFNDGIVPALRSFTKQESDQILFYDANNGLEYVEDGSYANFDQPPPPRRQPVRNRHIRRRRSYSVDSIDAARCQPQPRDVAPLTEEQLLLCSPFVKGFGLSSKIWASFRVSELEEIEWNEKAFENLVLPNEEKDMILGFAEGHIKCKGEFDDFIEGKGKGVVMLLNGPPGVGKTLTAEAVAETMHVPLYVMGAGELGIKPRDVDDNLEKALQRCTAWDAVLLLDEAEIFLQSRDMGNLMRNELVSIFLRHLEYYQGIMILTTNRSQAIDPAFESRIDIAVRYEALKVSSRRQVWQNFITRLPEGDREILESDFDLLATIDLNGRQIKSIVKTAQLLAVRKQQPLKIDQIKSVIRLKEKSMFGQDLQ